MICRKCKGPTTVYRTYGKKTITRERRCEKCAEQWETGERETPGTRVCYRDAICSAPVAQGRQVGATSSSDLKSQSGPQSNPDQTPARQSEGGAIVLTFPVVASDGPTWSLREPQQAEWIAAFPAIDVSAQCKQALAWLNANPANRKTAKGMASFLFRWLSKAQNQAPKKAAPVDARCAYHRNPGTRGKLPRFGAIGDCPECKHALAASRSRASDPTPVAAIVPATREEIARARGTG